MKVSFPSESPRHISQEGRYFEIRVEEIVPGWVGGLGIGVAQQPSQNIDGLKRLPDKAWRIPKTTVVGDLVKGPGGWDDGDDGGWVMVQLLCKICNTVFRYSCLFSSCFCRLLLDMNGFWSYNVLHLARSVSYNFPFLEATGAASSWMGANTEPHGIRIAYATVPKLASSLRIPGTSFSFRMM